MRGIFDGLLGALHGKEIGCGPAVFLVLLTALGALGLVALVWWGVRGFL